MAFPILGIFTGLVELGKLWFENRKTKAEGEIEITKAKTEGAVKRAQTALEQEGAYNVAAQEGMRFSWKDEWLTLLWSLPFILSFIPATQEIVKNGFIMLKNNTPDWYQWGFIGILVASFGLKGWNFWNAKNGNTNFNNVGS